MLSSSYGIIMDCAINAQGHGSNVVDVLNATEKLYFKGDLELIDKLGSNKTKKIGILPTASKNFSD